MSTAPRRLDRAVSSDEALGYLARAEAGVLVLSHDNEPYGVPLHFVLRDRTMYFHCALSGRKLDIIRHNPSCQIVVHFLDAIVEGEEACDFGSLYRSAVAHGQARIVESPEEKVMALNVLTEKFATHPFNPVSADGASRVAVVAVDLKSWTGKSRHA